MTLQHGQFGRVVVAIPVKDEAEEIAGCLHALAAQENASLDAVTLCLNNCTDDSARAVQRVAESLPFPVHLVDVHLAPDRACAGVARRIAMDRAAELAGANGIVLSTDADGRASADWVAANLASLHDGADAVAGQAEIDPQDARQIPAHLHDIDAQECAYAALLDEIRSLLDPDPADPWPRHDQHPGASIGVTVEAYHRAGGLPPIALGEDRAFFDALSRVDARIRHALRARVIVSGRLVGRAPGGMADTMRRRIQCIDEFLDDRLERVSHAARRAHLRARLHNTWQTRTIIPPSLAARLGLEVHEIETLMTERYFGMTWAAVENRSTVLQRRLVPLAELPAQMGRARILRDALRAADAATPAGDPADNGLLVAAE